MFGNAVTPIATKMRHGQDISQDIPKEEYQNLLDILTLESQAYESQGYSWCLTFDSAYSAKYVSWMQTNRNLKCMPVYDGGHPSYWSIETNLLFRFIHDMHHITQLLSFTINGEIAAYEYAQARWGALYPQLFTPMVQNILFSEIVGQACYYEKYQEFMDEQKIVLFL